MSGTPRFVHVKAVKTSDGEIIPVWDSRLSYEYTEEYGDEITLKGNRESFLSFIDVIFDIVSKTLSAGGITIDVYPSVTTHFKNDIVLTEQRGIYILDKIEEISFEKFETTILKGANIEPYHIKGVNIEIDPLQIYCIKTWTPTYLCKSGFKATYEYQVKKLKLDKELIKEIIKQ